MSTRAAIYVRVSTDGQTTANQLPELHELAARRGLTVVRTYEETESGAKRRPVLEQLRSEARGFDVVLVWALDRLGRGGALEALSLLADLDRQGVSVVSAREHWLDTSRDNPMKDVLIAFAATIAKMERARLVERTRAGLVRAKAQGKRLGRPRATPLALGIAYRARHDGASLEAAARAGGVSVATLKRHLAAQKGGAAPQSEPPRKSTT